MGRSAQLCRQSLRSGVRGLSSEDLHAAKTVSQFDHAYLWCDGRRFAVYVHSDARGWYSAQTFQVTAEDQNKELVVPITFEDTPTIDKFIIVGEKNATFSVEYSMGVKDVQIT